ncbi:MAG TPA: hypothetical protein VKX17_14725 [Planctomycetota bacterium]|nr:hypothetical protein [Planctomycetota bacterium]
MKTCGAGGPPAKIQFDSMKKALSVLFLALMLVGVAGCHRSEDDFDDRTLAQRPHVETMHPEDRKDIFRP